ncbi:hypothetical protein X975_14315, partial [Stegodyphus mimosarum]
MWGLLLLSLLIVSSGAQDVDDACSGEYSRSCKQEPMGFPDNEEQLEAYCPDALKFFECQKEYQVGCNKDAKEVTAVLEVIGELCQKDSDLHKAIASHLKCIKDSFYQSTCGNTAYLETVNAYSNYEGEGLSDDIGSKTFCMVEAYAVACVGDVIASNCGNAVKEAILDMVRRTDYIGSKMTCTDNIRAGIIQDLPQLQINEIYKN